MENEMVIRNLNRLCRDYDGINKLIVSIKNRLGVLNPDADPDHDPTLGGYVRGNIKYHGLNHIKGRVASKIEKELEFWPIWMEWIKGVPGVGTFIAGNLILLYYYRFVPICPKCGARVEKKDKTFWCSNCEKSLRGDGVLSYEIEHKDFRQVSAWWHYLGMHIVNGNKPKRKKGETSSWSTRGRTIGYQIGDQFNRQKDDHPYKAFLLRAKEKHLRKNDEREKPWTPGHIHNAGRNEAAKLFLSHFWHVARTLDGKPITGPWIIEHGGHTGIIPPYYWEPKV